jgi:hypothetical protein
MAMSPSLTFRDKVLKNLFREERGSRQLGKDLEKLMGTTMMREIAEVATTWSSEIAAAAAKDTKVTY